MGNLLTILGLIVVFIGAIWIIVEAFKTSILWGIGGLLIHFILLIFVILHWEVAKKPFLIYLAGIGLVFVGLMLSPHAHEGTVTPL